VLLALPWRDQPGAIALLLLSDVVGIATGDSFYLAALRCLGNRRPLTVEALSPLVASVAGVGLMDERVSGQACLGAALVTALVVLVVSQTTGHLGSPRLQMPPETVGWVLSAH